jgi:hypothetical protein
VADLRREISARQEAAARAERLRAQLAALVVPDAALHGLNETWSLGDFSYRVTNIQSRRRLGNDFVSETAAPGASFVIVEYVETNNGQESVTGMADTCTLRDVRGRTFRPSSRAQTALLMSGRSHDLALSELQPSVPHQSATAFEVPNDAIDGPFAVVFTERGLLGTGQAYVRAMFAPPGS